MSEQTSPYPSGPRHVKGGPGFPGERFGRLITLKNVGQTVHLKPIWLCQCDCGKLKEVVQGDLRFGRTRSCGCLLSEVSSERFTTHGATVGGETNEYMVWKTAKQRTSNSKQKNFRRYGGRGILMCEEFRADFGAFLRELGPKPTPDGHWTVERVDNDKGYEPGNIRWATAAEQAQNSSRTRLSWEDVRDLRRKGKYATWPTIAADYGVGRSCVRAALAGLTWRE